MDATIGKNFFGTEISNFHTIFLSLMGVPRLLNLDFIPPNLLAKLLIVSFSPIFKASSSLLKVCRRAF
ncbi:hypothetical protein Hdeb2414_s0022g00611961 [Helianthus debilis subsp. tardiflorus]